MQEKNGNAITATSPMTSASSARGRQDHGHVRRLPVEFGTADETFYGSRHPYTWGLIRLDPKRIEDEKQPSPRSRATRPRSLTHHKGLPLLAQVPLRKGHLPETQKKPEPYYTSTGHYTKLPLPTTPSTIKANAPETSLRGCEGIEGSKEKVMADEKSREPFYGGVEHLTKEFPIESGGLRRAGAKRVHAVEDISLEIYPGETSAS